MSDRQHIDTESYKKNKRIASNTVLLFIRMVVITIINLYAVRLVLNGLGTTDYGLFNAIAGVVTTTIFLTSVLELSIQRFYSFAIGKNDKGSLNEIFSISVNIILKLSLIIIILFETIGLWFVHDKLNIPPERMTASGWTFQFSLFAFICTILQIPFTAAFFAHEEMGLYALVSTIDCLFRLVVAILIGVANIDNLVFYSAGLLAVSIIILAIYAFLGHYRYKECTYRHYNNYTLLNKIVAFSGWNLFGSLAKMSMIQGSIILLNIFFNSIVVASFAIANQIQNALNTLSNSMVLALRPAMIKAYAECKFDYLNQLFSVSNKFILYVLLTFSLPIIAEMDTILEWWLDNSTAEMVHFSRLMIVYVVCLAMNYPITIIMQASGHVKEYFVPVESITLLSLPATWILFKMDCPSYTVFYAMIVVCLLAHVARIICLKHFYRHFSIREYFVTIVLPSIIILAFGIALVYGLHSWIVGQVVRFITVFLTSPLFILLTAYWFGINSKERNLTVTMLMTFFNKVCNRS